MTVLRSKCNRYQNPPLTTCYDELLMKRTCKRDAFSQVTSPSLLTESGIDSFLRLPVVSERS